MGLDSWKEKETLFFKRMEGVYKKSFKPKRNSYPFPTPFLINSILFLLLLLLSCPSPIQGIKAVNYNWFLRLEKLRTEAFDRLFPRELTLLLRALDPYVGPDGGGFVDIRDPLEVISYVTLYLPAALFILNVLFFMIPHILNFLIFTPKLWFFSIPCLYSFHMSPLKRRKRSLRKGRTRRNAFFFNQNQVAQEEDPPGGPCDSVNLAHITRLVYKGLLKLTEQQE